MIANKLKEIEAAKAKIAALEKSMEAEISRELASLPAKYGFASVKAFAAAVKAAVGGTGKIRSSAKAAAPADGAKRRTRAVITDTTRADVKKLVEAGKSGSVIAKTLKISLPSVPNIKKALGLVKPRTR